MITLDPKTMTPDERSKVEADFRYMMFNTYLHKAFAEEPSPTIRFVKAIVLSSELRPIPDWKAVVAWWLTVWKKQSDPDMPERMDRIVKGARKRRNERSIA